MLGLYAGESPKYFLKIKNSSDVQLDPSNVSQVIQVRVWIYNTLDGTSIAKFIYPTSPPAGWRAGILKTIAAGDKRVMFTLTAAETLAAKGNMNDIQVELTLYDADCPNNRKIEIGQTHFGEIGPSQI